MISQPIEAPRTLGLLPAATLAEAWPEPGQPSAIGLIGRERELAQLNVLVANVRESGSAMLIRGAPGIGKSALVSALLAGVRSKPVSILRASGIRAEANLPYAGLHQLLRPVLGELGSLRRQLRRAIEAALRMSSAPPPDPLLISIATLDLLSAAARPGLVVVVEDAHWLDRPTSEVLSFVARRLSSDPIVLLITARDNRRSPILEAGLDELTLKGLGDDEVPAFAPYGVEPEQVSEPAPAPLFALRDATSAGHVTLRAGIASAVAGDLVRSRLLLERAGPALRSDDNRPLLAQLLVMQAWNDIHLGRWADAASQIAEGARLARDTHQTSWSAFADAADALFAAMRGDEESLDRALTRARTATVAERLGWLAATIEVVRGIGDLNAGRADSAYTRLLDQLTTSDDACLWAIDHFADAAVLTGKVEDGRALLRASNGAAERPGPLQSAALVSARAVLADDSTAEQLQAQAIADLAPWPIHQARLQLHHGAWLRRHRRAAESRAPLRAARDLFEAIGAAPLAERARRELRASGERSRRRDIAAWDQLSPQESEIAQMAAKGLSNREIGEQLFLSHRTVGAHLYRIFPKLGVTSRGQLHTVLAAGAGGHTVASP